MKLTQLTASVALMAALTAGYATAQDWTGPYVSGHLDATSIDDDDSERLMFDTDRDGAYDDTVRTGAGADAFSPGFCAGAPNGNNAAAGCESDDDNTTDYGVRLGYDWQSGNWVYGVVGEYSKVEIDDNVTGFSTTPAAYHMRREIDGALALRARLGYAYNDWLVYGTAGVVRADIERAFATTNGANSFTPSGGDDGTGSQIGFGVERKTLSNWSFGVEYMMTNVKDEGYNIAVGPGTAPATNPFLIVSPTGTDFMRSSDEIKNHSIRFTASYRFGGMM